VPRPFRPLLIAFIVIALVILALALEVLRVGGAFRSVRSMAADSCRAIEVGGSVHDIRIDRERGLAYLSFRDRDKVTGITGNGTVVMLDLNLAEPAPRAAMSRNPEDFRPEGIALLQRAGQPTKLLATSRGGGVPTVEIMERDDNGAFVPELTVRDVALGSPTRVAPAGTSIFYAVDHVEPMGWLPQKLSLLTKRGRDAIVVSDMGKSDVIASGHAWLSGLVMNEDDSRLYAVDALKQQLLVYRRDASRPGSLTLENAISLPAPPASLDRDADGVLWIATYPKLLRHFAAAAGSPGILPTVVLRFDPRRPDEGAVTVFADDGSQITGGTIAAHWRDELLVGAPFDHKVLICKLNP
jgi:hypothetical protein